MTDTRMFKTTAWTKQGLVRTFFGPNHHQRAVDWLEAQAADVHKNAA